MEFLSEWGSQIVLSLVIAALTYVLNKNMKAKDESMKQYQELLAKEADDKTKKEIDVQLEPIYKELEDIRKYILSLQEKEDKDLEDIKGNFKLIIASYKYRLVQLCKEFLKQGFMYQYQYDQLNEFYTLYHKLGGNGQGTSYYEKVCNELKVRPDP